MPSTSCGLTGTWPWWILTAAPWCSRPISTFASSHGGDRKGSGNSSADHRSLVVQSPSPSQCTRRESEGSSLFQLALPVTEPNLLSGLAGGSMPEKKMLERAREDALEGKAPSTQAGEFVRKRWSISGK